MKSNMRPRVAEESGLGEIFSLEIARCRPRCGQDRATKGVLVKSLG